MIPDNNPGLSFVPKELILTSTWKLMFIAKEKSLFKSVSTGRQQGTHVSPSPAGQ